MSEVDENNGAIMGENRGVVGRNWAGERCVDLWDIMRCN